jgi:hypothetical protein
MTATIKPTVIVGKIHPVIKQPVDYAVTAVAH